MAKETKAGLLWKCPYDAAFHFGLAHDCEAQIGKNDCGDFIGKCDDTKPYLCIPVAEAREFLRAVDETADSAADEEAAHGILFKDTDGFKLRETARALLAKLPEEE